MNNKLPASMRPGFLAWRQPAESFATAAALFLSLLLVLRALRLS